LLVQALEILEQQLGADHPDTAYPLLGLAKLYQCQSKYERAGALYRRALAIREQHLGLNHPDAQNTRRAYAAFLHVVGRDEEATALDIDHKLPGEEGH
jgi:tetratricopeptide (TPR) repeat protein